ncbi:MULTISPECIES: phosphopantetheine-binding protein [Desulfosporosinus]|uniref:phosphopantetheine-binding protein n=1 Tax=Desulfosporosinus TaxID=79206 RepID=UPI00207C9EC8|nr:MULTISPECIES: phosphopantetheine-binding protein [Desulfosporosinus]MCO1602833.1 phosphopantetheine-binding protein [Desulfosporosinus nitroreducens]MCO5388546.1 phosphopantetheine-binding protein [Desulfosporosinus sp.]MDA8222942.1 phosphopantetheine-binding protein [Desulfitobacterium hafniense]
MEDRVLFTLNHILQKKKRKITLESRLREDLFVDSIDMSMIIGDLEDEFEITITDDEFANVVTVNDIVENLRARGLSDYRSIIYSV